jgi:hypothetical protein
MDGVNCDFDAFAAQVVGAKASPDRVLRAGLHLIDGALRIRHHQPEVVGGDALAFAPVSSKSAEAVRAWLKSMEPELRSGRFSRHAELREAMVAAGEEVGKAAADAPSARRLERALYEDALTAVGGAASDSWLVRALPWIIASLCAGLTLGVLLGKRR